MNNYELTVVVSAKLDDEARAAKVDKVKEYIERFGGKITNVDEAGLKELAYEIEKMKEAYYYFITIETDNTDMTRELESRLRIMDDVMRFMCVTVEA